MSRTTAPYLPTPPEIVKRMLKIARVGPGDVVYDARATYDIIDAVMSYVEDASVSAEQLVKKCKLKPHAHS